MYSCVGSWHIVRWTETSVSISVRAPSMPHAAPGGSPDIAPAQKTRGGTRLRGSRTHTHDPGQPTHAHDNSHVAEGKAREGGLEALGARSRARCPPAWPAEDARVVLEWCGLRRAFAPPVSRPTAQTAG
jgi:hypothetical protein